MGLLCQSSHSFAKLVQLVIIVYCATSIKVNIVIFFRDVFLNGFL
jgi:hypothetical protein